MSRSGTKRFGDASQAMPDVSLTKLLDEMVGLSVMFAGQVPWAMISAKGAANLAYQPDDVARDDLFDNLPV